MDAKKASLINRLAFFFNSASFNEALVRMRGLEPPRCLHHRLLRPARLPVPPHPQKWGTSLCECLSRVSRMQRTEAAYKANPRAANQTSVSPMIPPTPVTVVVVAPAVSPIVIVVSISPSAPGVTIVPLPTISRASTVHTPITRIMTIHKLIAFFAKA